MKVFHQMMIAFIAIMLLQSPFLEAAPLNFEGAPVNYSAATPQNVITQLQRELDAGEKLGRMQTISVICFRYSRI